MPSHAVFPGVREQEETAIEHAYQELLLGLLRDGRHVALPAPMREIEKLLHDSLPAALSPTAPKNYPELLDSFSMVTDQLREFVLSSCVRDKSIVAFGGSFSSGKSSMINSLLGKRLLPTEITPTTAVATYVVRGEPRALLVNRDYFTHSMPLDAVHIIAHGFYGPENDETDFPQELSHHIRSLTVCTDSLREERLALLDTPGYTGEQNASTVRTMLAGANALVWVVNAEAGTLTGEEVRFLHSLHGGMEKLIVINKCDKKTAYDVSMIKRQVASVLKQNGIEYADILTYSSRRPGDYDLLALRDFLERWNVAAGIPQFAQSYYNLFGQCLDFYTERIFLSNRRLNKVAAAMSTLAQPDPNLADVVRELREESRELARQKELLLRTRAMTLDAMTRLGEEIGVPFPKAQEITETIRRTDMLSLVRFEKEKLALRSGDTSYRLAAAFAGIDLRMHLARGGSQFSRQFEQAATRSLGELGKRPPRYSRNLTGADRFAPMLRSHISNNRRAFADAASESK